MKLMVRIKNYARLTISGGTKPGHAEPFKGENRRNMREEWAEFCTKHCPHPDLACEWGACKEFKAKFGRRRAY